MLIVRQELLALSSFCRWENRVKERVCNFSKVVELIKCWSQVWLRSTCWSFHTPLILYAPTTPHYFQFWELISSLWPGGLHTCCSLCLECLPQKSHFCQDSIYSLITSLLKCHLFREVFPYYLKLHYLFTFFMSPFSRTSKLFVTGSQFLEWHSPGVP